jgi:aminomethyltransferase
MPIPTPFHPRTCELCTSFLWKDWSGYYSVRSYDTYPEREYFAIRHTAGLIDVTPLFKYEVVGPDAPEFLSRIMVKNIQKMKIGQVAYLCWCDEAGKVIDDGTVSRLDESYFRVTSNAPNLAWFRRFSRGYDVTIIDSTHRIGALALQGPQSREILEQVSDADIDHLKYFQVTKSKLDGVDVHISRTGFTGDLGYEIWVKNENAVQVYDTLLYTGVAYGLLPAGLDAMDVTRIEAGFILYGVDYFGANHAMIESRKSSPFELGLGWTVGLKRKPFTGQPALKREKKEGPRRRLVGLELGWDELEKLFADRGLPPEVPSAAWRHSVPVYNDAGSQVGYANSGAWSPILKCNLALATVESAYSEIGTRLQFEVTVEYERRTVPATVVEKPFFNPERKRS